MYKRTTINKFLMSTCQNQRSSDCCSLLPVHSSGFRQSGLARTSRADAPHVGFWTPGRKSPIVVIAEALQYVCCGLFPVDTLRVSGSLVTSQGHDLIQAVTFDILLLPVSLCTMTRCTGLHNCIFHTMMHVLERFFKTKISQAFKYSVVVLY